MVTGAAGQCNELGSPRAANPFEEMSRGRPARFIYERQCSGKAYWKQLESEFDTAAGRADSSRTRFQMMNQQFVRQLRESLRFSPAVQIEASPFVSAQVARVAGKLHVFLANFKGLKSEVSAQQMPERKLRIAFPTSAGTRVFLLPFMGETREMRVERDGGKLTCTIPEITKGAVVWIQ
jgi:hypothetical protein